MIEQKNFTIYRSSAGSGKTYTLVRDYLRLALAMPHPMGFRHILAITFTNKAAEEMKTRVLKQLAELADNPQNHMMEYLSQELDMQPEAISKKSSQILRNMLHNYAELGICTIDKFTHQLVRAFSRDLMLNHDFDVDTDNLPLLEEAVARLIEQVGRDKLITSVLVDFVESQLDNDRSWIIERSLIDTAKKKLGLQSEDYLNLLETYPVEQFAELKKQLKAFASAFEKDIQEQGERAMKQIEQHQLTPADFYYTKSGIYGYFKGLAGGDALKSPNSYVQKSLENNLFENSKAEVHKAEIIQELGPMFHAVCRAVEEIRGERESTYRLCTELLGNLHQLLLLNELRKELNQLKEDRNMIFVDDFHRLIADVVKDEPAPFIYERIGQRYRHLLIDEFQDTSVLQWNNFLPLVSDALSTGGTVMLVGDGKQAIYRWRGGEVEQFDRLPEIYPPSTDLVTLERQRLLESQYNPNHLEKNYRSLGEVVRFNNSLFDFLQQFVPDSLRSVYKDVAQQVEKKDDAGLVTLELLDFPARGQSEEKQAAYLQSTSQYIEEALNDGYAQRDICIIVRSNKDGRLIAGHLQHQQIAGEEIEVISSESLLINNHPAVKLVISTLRYLTDPGHTGFGLDLLLRLIRQLEPDKDFHTILQEFTKRNDKRELIRAEVNPYLKSQGKEAIHRGLLTMSLYEMIEQLARQLGGNGFNNPYWSFFKQQVLGFSTEKGNDLPAFLAWWDKKCDSLSLSIPEDSNAIRLMSVHKSKGLQFPVVIVPFADWNLKVNHALHWALMPDEIQENFTCPVPPVMLSGLGARVQETSLWDQIKTEDARIALDNLNLLYVATTRAEERLYLISLNNALKKETASNVGQWITAFAGEKGWNGTTLRFGVEGNRSQYFPDKKQSASADSKPPEALNVASNSGWKDKIRISLEAGELIGGQIAPTSAASGNLVHRILAEINTPEDLEIRLQWHQHHGAIDNQQAAVVRDQISAMFNHPTAGKWFEPHEKVMVEHAIVSPDGTTARPDRIVIDGDEATIIDFKTGEYRIEHENQIQQYGDLLHAMNYRCHLHLYYLENNEVRSISSPAQTSLF